MQPIELVDEASARHLDRELRAAVARASRGMSPVELGLAYIDWLAHLALSPGKQALLLQSFINKLSGAGGYALRALVDAGAQPPETRLERRVSAEAWQHWPFNVMARSHQLAKDWWREATSDVDGVSREHLVLMQAVAEQILDMLSPANFLATNPEVLRATAHERGRNLWRGLRLFVKDRLRDAGVNGVEEHQQFRVGENVAITPGKVIYRNALIELIQYAPATEAVRPEPVLICPPWIMKYYILDLSPGNSLVRYLTQQGKTVFMISWKNPGREDADVGLDDYLHQGLLQALQVVNAVCPGHLVHAVGYCIGGTLLSMGAALLARDDDARLASVSLFAAQTDFSEAGEITRFISPSQLAFLDTLMWKQGYLGIENMGGAFSSLRASELIYAGAVDRYLLGKEAVPSDLMAWNADGTRMPYRMHSEYLHKLYLENQLARNELEIEGRPVSLEDIRTPLFVVGTESDHVAPWRSVYKLHGLTGVELTFLLTSGGHNAGIISGPSHPRRRYRVHARQPGDKYTDPDRWLGQHAPVAGSWWPVWNDWLDARSGQAGPPPALGAPAAGYPVLGPAPGEYVFG